MKKIIVVLGCALTMSTGGCSGPSQPSELVGPTVVDQTPISRAREIGNLGRADASDDVDSATTDELAIDGALDGIDAAAKLADCGGVPRTQGNNYPCCPAVTKGNDKGRKNGGNCTYYVWERAYQKWGLKLPGWGNARSWATRAGSDSRFAVSKTKCAPNTIAVRSIGVGHVAWVEECLSGGRVRVREQMWCEFFGVRSHTHASGYFNAGFIAPATAKPLWTRSGSGNATFTMPSHVKRVRIEGVYEGWWCGTFIVKIASQSMVNVILSTVNETFLGPCPVAIGKKYDRAHLTTGGAVVVGFSPDGMGNWTFTEVR